MNKEEIDILYSFANDEDCRYVYDWQGFNYEEICPLIDKLIKENKKYKEVIDKATNELFILKDMIYKPETREENFEIQRKISSIIKRLNGKEVE